MDIVTATLYAAGIGAAAVAVGTLVSAALARSSAHQQWLRDARLQAYAQFLEAYTRASDAAKKYVVTARVAATSDESNDSIHERLENPLAEAWSQHTDAYRNLTERQAAVDLVGPDRLARRAFSMHASVGVVFALRTFLLSADRQQAVEHYDDWMSKSARRAQARSDFVKLAKSVIQSVPTHRRVWRFIRRHGSRLLAAVRRLPARLRWWGSGG